MRGAGASELNLAVMRSYSSAENQLNSIGQFSDLRPSDWAYQALTNLVERYGCVAGYPNGIFKPAQTLTDGHISGETVVQRSIMPPIG